MRGQLPEPYVRVVRQVADPRQGQAGHPQRPVRLGEDLAAGLRQDRRQLLPLRRLGPRRPHPGEVGGVRRDEVLDAHVREQLPPADHDQVVRRQRHLAHEVAGDEDRPALRGQLLHQVPHPEDALGVQAVDGLVEEQHLRVAEERRRDAEPLAHAEREALRAPLGHVLEADHAQDLVHPLRRDAGELGEREQMAARAPAAVHGLGVQERAHLPRRVRQLPDGWPPIVTWPAEGWSSPRIIRIVVDLPEPLGPRKPVTTPGLTRKERSYTAVLAP